MDVDGVELTTPWRVEPIRASTGVAPTGRTATSGRPRQLEPGCPSSRFHVIPRGWAVERAFARLTPNRRLSKDYERLCATRKMCIYLAMIRLILRRLACS
jgi:transposase